MKSSLYIDSKILCKIMIGVPGLTNFATNSQYSCFVCHVIFHLVNTHKFNLPADGFPQYYNNNYCM